MYRTMYDYLNQGRIQHSRRMGCLAWGRGRGGRAPTNDFAKYFNLLHEIEKMLGRMGAPPRSATVNGKIKAAQTPPSWPFVTIGWVDLRVQTSLFSVKDFLRCKLGAIKVYGMTPMSNN